MIGGFSKRLTPRGAAFSGGTGEGETDAVGCPAGVRAGSGVDTCPEALKTASRISRSGVATLVVVARDMISLP
jgi:hypothetical protein